MDRMKARTEKMMHLKYVKNTSFDKQAYVPA